MPAGLKKIVVTSAADAEPAVAVPTERAPMKSTAKPAEWAGPCVKQSAMARDRTASFAAAEPRKGISSLPFDSDDRHDPGPHRLGSLGQSDGKRCTCQFRQA